MSLYVGVLGINTFDDEIDDVVDTLSTSITININDTSNYVLATSNFLVKRITDEIEHTSNYVLTTSNILIGRINDTSNYADRLDLCIKTLEGTEESPGDISLGIPPIPATGGVALVAGLVTVMVDCVTSNGITTLSLIEFLEAKVDANKTQDDKT